MDKKEDFMRMMEGMRSQSIAKAIEAGAKVEDVERMESIIQRVHPMVAEAMHMEIESISKLITRCRDKEERLTVLETIGLWAKVQSDIMKKPKEGAVDIEVK